MNHILANAKAYAALVGAVLTAVLANSDSAPTWLAIAAAVCTAVATWSIPNSEPVETDERGAADAGLILLVAVLLCVVLLLFGVRF